MARSHHRKKHREHVKQFRQSHDTATSAGSNGKALTIVMIIGALTGFAVAFFASGGVLLWMTVGLVLGATGGYFAGKRIDEGN
jgi:ABC-type dipeptide/oligopeptide/nickel transport system permease subunit